MLSKVKKFHREGWTIELRWGYYHEEAHFLVEAMKGLERHKIVSSNSMEEAFEKVCKLIEEAG